MDCHVHGWILVRCDVSIEQRCWDWICKDKCKRIYTMRMFIKCQILMLCGMFELCFVLLFNLHIFTIHWTTFLFSLRIVKIWKWLVPGTDNTTSRLTTQCIPSCTSRSPDSAINVYWPIVYWHLTYKYRRTLTGLSMNSMFSALPLHIPDAHFDIWRLWFIDPPHSKLKTTHAVPRLSVSDLVKTIQPPSLLD